MRFCPEQSLRLGNAKRCADFVAEFSHSLYGLILVIYSLI